MSFIDFIEKLQNKPRHIRVRILWFGVIFSTIIIGAIWMVSLAHSLKIVSPVELEQQEELKESSLPSLFSAIKKEISLLKKNLKAGFEGIIENNEEQEEPEENFEENLGDEKEYKRVRLPIE